MQVPSASAPASHAPPDPDDGLEVHVAHGHAVLAAGLVAILGPQARTLDRADGRSQAAYHPRGRLLVTDLAHALDLRAAGAPGLDARAILIVESGLNPQKIQRLLQAGLQSCVSADGAPQEFHQALRALRAGIRYFCPLACAHFGDALAQPSLTGREQQVLELLCRGLANKSIAARLRIAPGTVKCHVKAILSKTGKQSRTEAAADALCHGWVSRAP